MDTFRLTMNTRSPRKQILLWLALCLCGASYAANEQSSADLIGEKKTTSGAVLKYTFATNTAEKAKSADGADYETVLALDSSQADDQLQELELINKAQSTKAVEDYQAYLERYPNGAFVDLALAAIASADAASPSTAATTVDSTKPVVSNSPVADTGAGTITMDTLLVTSLSVLDEPKSIKQLIKGSPLFPPFEELDETYWKDEQCSNCHEWSKPNLCEQGNFYAGVAPEAVDRIEHPYGGFFKRAIKLWAASDCQ